MQKLVANKESLLIKIEAHPIARYLLPSTANFNSVVKLH